MDLTVRRASGLASRPNGAEDEQSLSRRGLGGRLTPGLSVNEHEVKQELLQRVGKRMDLCLLAGMEGKEAEAQDAYAEALAYFAKALEDVKPDSDQAKFIEEQKAAIPQGTAE